MAFQPKTEPGSSLSTTRKKGYSEMSIFDLVSVLRVAYQTEDFDKVEEELVNREAKLRAEIGPLRKKIELERLKSIEAEERLKSREEQCEKGKRAREHYEQMLKEVKKSGLVEKNTIEELRKKNFALERQLCELKEFKKKKLDGGESVGELRAKIRVLEGKKVGEKGALGSLNIELEEAVKKNLSVIEGLRTENGKLRDENKERKRLFECLEKKYSELRGSVVKLEDEIRVLMSEDASDGVSYAVKDEEVIDDYELENDNGEPVPFQRTKDTHCSKSPKKGNKDDDASGVKLKSDKKEIVDLSDDDDDLWCTNQGLHREKAISKTIGENEHPQRKHAYDIQTCTSTSTSYDDLFEIPLKKSKTTPLPGYFLTRRI